MLIVIYCVFAYFFHIDRETLNSLVIIITAFFGFSNLSVLQEKQLESQKNVAQARMKYTLISLKKCIDLYLPFLYEVAESIVLVPDKDDAVENAFTADGNFHDIDEVEKDYIDKYNDKISNAINRFYSIRSKVNEYEIIQYYRLKVNLSPITKDRITKDNELLFIINSINEYIEITKDIMNSGFIEPFYEKTVAAIENEITELGRHDKLIKVLSNNDNFMKYDEIDFFKINKPTKEIVVNLYNLSSELTENKD